MSRTMTQEERYRMMTEKPISRLIPGLAVPTIISMLITSIYNMADTFFVSQINTSASAAVGIIFSLMAMIQAVGFTLGMAREIIFPAVWEQKMKTSQCGRLPRPFLRPLGSAWSWQ